MTLRRNPHRQFLVLGTAARAAPGDAGHSGVRRTAGSRRPSARPSTARWRRCATCTSSTRSSGCRWSSGSPTCSARRRRRAQDRARRPSRLARPARGRTARRRASGSSCCASSSPSPARRARRSPAGSARPTTSRPSPATGSGRRTGWTSRRLDDTDRAARAGIQLRTLPLGRPRTTSRCSLWRRRPGRCATRCRSRPPATSGCSTPSSSSSPPGGRPPGSLGYLRRAGIGHLVVRNDLRATDDIPLPVLVHQALDGSPGLAKVADFGPDVGGPARLESRRGRSTAGRTTAAGTRVPRRGGLRGRRRAPTRSASEAPPLVVGGPEDLLDLLDAGLLGDEPAVLAADAGEPGAEASARGPLLLTDGLRRREAHLRAHRTTAGPPRWRPTTTAGAGAPARDYVVADASRWETTARILGARSVTASGVARVRRHRRAGAPGDASLRSRSTADPRPSGSPGLRAAARTRGWRSRSSARWRSGRSRSSRARPARTRTPPSSSRRRPGPRGRSGPRPASRSWCPSPTGRRRGCGCGARTSTDCPPSSRSPRSGPTGSTSTGRSCCPRCRPGGERPTACSCRPARSSTPAWRWRRTSAAPLAASAPTRAVGSSTARCGSGPGRTTRSH